MSVKPEIKLWSVEAGKMVRLATADFSSSHKEKDLEEWVEQEPSLLGRELTVIGRQVRIPGVGPLDLLAVDTKGRLVVIEFKRRESTRDAIAQILDYASAIRLMKLEDLRKLPNVELSAEAPDIAYMEPALILVAAEADEAAERIVHYLASIATLEIEVVTFTYAVTADGREIVARSILTPEPSNPAAKLTTEMSRDQLFKIADDRRVHGLFEALDRVTEWGWSTQMYSSVGGKIRYLAKGRVIFGVYVGGGREKFNTPPSELDVWIRTVAAAEFSGDSPDEIQAQLQKFSTVKSTATSKTIRLKTQKDADDVYALLKNWNAKSETVVVTDNEADE